MQIYLVGGAVRDKRLGLPVKDRDWVVVGASPAELLAQGYAQVGKDFPVFLHPETREEYALARTEVKTAPGYHGFSVQASPDVTLEQDLQRRDLTINAMAEDAHGALIDPFNGARDLEARLLRHVSPAFTEDPVRILRVARFAARFADQGFRIAAETRDLMRAMVDAGEVDALVPERVWQEVVRALGEPSPARFFEALRECGALARLFPELERLFGVPQPPEHHPEVDTGVHVMMVLTQAARLSQDTRVRFAALVHDLGKGITPADEWPRHIKHEERGVPLVRALCERLKVPSDYHDLAILVTRYHLHYHRAGELRADTTLKLLEAVDAFRRSERFEQFLLACEADARGRPGYEDREFAQTGMLREALATAGAAGGAVLARGGLSGAAIGEAIREARLTALRATRGDRNAGARRRDDAN